MTDVDTSAPAPVRRWTSVEIGRGDLGRMELLVVAIIAVFPLAALPIAWRAEITPKLALGFVLAGVGLPVLVVLVRARDRAAIAGAAFLAIVWASTAAARHPWPTAIGNFDGFASALLYTVAVGAWAAGRVLQPAGRRWLPAAALIGTIATAVIVWLQHLGVELGWIVPAFEDRPAALASNPVFAGALMASALVLLVTSVARDAAPARGRWWASLGGAALLASGVNLSGGRIALGAAAVGLALALRTADRRRWGALIVAIVIGIALSSVVGGGSGSSVARVGGEGSGGLAARADMWSAGLDGWKARPILGVGPGRFAEASGPSIPESFAANEAPGSFYEDAHDLGVELLTTVGIVGLVGGAAWLAFAAHRARGPLALAALTYGVNLLLEPVSVTALWALVLLGAATTLAPATSPRSATVRWGSLLVAFGAAAIVLAASIALYLGRSDGSTATVRLADRLLPPMVEPSQFEYRALMTSLPPPGPGRARWLRELEAVTDRAIAADPARAEAWYSSGQAAVFRGDDEAALRAYLEALRLNPQNPNTLTAVETTAGELGQTDLAEEARAHRCRIAPDDDCPAS